MKNIKYVIFSILFLFFNIFYVQASCTNEEISALRDDAKKIKVIYKHMGAVEREEYIDYNSFDVTVKNISDDFTITYSGGTETLVVNNNTAKVTLSNGNWYFKVFSNKCDEEIDVINVFLPKFNMYSLDPLCDGIDGGDFPLCGKYYEYDVNYDDFLERVNHYRITNNIDIEGNDNKNNDKNSVKLLWNTLYNFIINNSFYLIISLLVILIFILIMVIINKRKKRGVLQ